MHPHLLHKPTAPSRKHAAPSAQCLLHYALCMLFSLLFAACQRDFNAQMQKEAADFTRNNCPWMLEIGTTLDSLTYSPADSTLTRWFTLSETNADAVEAEAGRYILLLRQQLHDDVIMKGAKDGGAAFRYVYRREGGRVILDCRFTKNDY